MTPRYDKEATIWHWRYALRDLTLVGSAVAAIGVGLNIYGQWRDINRINQEQTKTIESLGRSVAELGANFSKSQRESERFLVDFITVKERVNLCCPYYRGGK